MGSDDRRNAHKYLVSLSGERGYITLDDIMDVADRNELPLSDVDWLSNSLATMGILIYDSVPQSATSEDANEDEEEYADYAQCDYNAIYDRVVQLDPSLEGIIDYVRNVKPPQFRELRKLLEQSFEGNSYARERLIMMNLRVAVRIALNRAEKYDTDISENLQDSFLSLVQAVDSYNPYTYYGNFVSFISLHILQSFERGQDNQRPLIHYPQQRREDFFNLYPRMKEYGCLDCSRAYKCGKLRRMAQSCFGSDFKYIEGAINQCLPLESLDAICQLDSEDNEEEQRAINDDFKYYIPFLAYEDSGFSMAEESAYAKSFEAIFDNLSEREKFIIHARYGFIDGMEWTLNEVGEYYGVTRERIRQIEGKAMLKMRRHIETLMRR